MFAQEFCFYNFKRYSIKTNTFHYNSLLPLQRIAATWMSVKVSYGAKDETKRLHSGVCLCSSFSHSVGLDICLKYLLTIFEYASFGCSCMTVLMCLFV